MKDLSNVMRWTDVTLANGKAHHHNSSSLNVMIAALNRVIYVCDPHVRQTVFLVLHPPHMTCAQCSAAANAQDNKVKWHCYEI
jgi:hypothetical protein